MRMYGVMRICPTAAYEADVEGFALPYVLVEDVVKTTRHRLQSSKGDQILGMPADDT